MSDRRLELIGKFRAVSHERLRRMSASLADLATGVGGEAARRTLARELHTLKGDARVVGFAALSEAVHRAEELLSRVPETGAPDPEVLAALEQALESFARDVRVDPVVTEASAVPAVPQQGTEGFPQRAASETAAPTPSAGPGSPKFVPVNVAHIEDLCERVAVLGVDLARLRSRVVPATGADGAVEHIHLRDLAEDLERTGSELDEIAASAWSLRLVPVEPVLADLIPQAHEIARAQGKRLAVSVRGGGAEMERGVLDELWDPFLHLVRNAVDHGIERVEDRRTKNPTGQLVLTAEPVASSVVLTIADDGCGVDLDAVRAVAVTRGWLPPSEARSASAAETLELLFRHGFSTRAAADELSGRGVGLDVVRSRVESLGGSVSIVSKAGEGTRFTVTVPAAISRERHLVVACGGALYAVRSRHVDELMRIEDCEITEVAGGRALRHRGENLGLRSFGATLGLAEEGEERWILVLESAGRRVAFSVAALAGETNLLRRPLDALLALRRHFSASGVLEDGRLVLVLQVAGLFRRADAHAAAPPHRPAPRRRVRVLVVDDSPVVRDLVSEILVRSGLEVRVATDGRAALAILEDGDPDLVVSDVEMPGMDGFELLRRIRARTQLLPVVMLSTRGSAQDRRKATSLGADAYLVKSEFRDATLIETVRRFVELRA